MHYLYSYLCTLIHRSLLWNSYRWNSPPQGMPTSYRARHEWAHLYKTGGWGLCVWLRTRPQIRLWCPVRILITKPGDWLNWTLLSWILIGLLPQISNTAYHILGIYVQILQTRSHSMALRRFSAVAAVMFKHFKIQMKSKMKNWIHCIF